MRNLTVIIKGINDDSESENVASAFSNLAKLGWVGNAEEVLLDLKRKEN